MSVTTTSTKDVLTLIRLASTVEEADGYIEEFIGIHTFKEKLKFVWSEFGARIIGRYPEEKVSDVNENLLEDDYWAILNAIISKKWR